MCVSYLRTSCLVPSDFRLGSGTGQARKKVGEVVGRQEEERTVVGFSLSDGRKKEGDGRRLSRRVGCVCPGGGGGLGIEEAGSDMKMGTVAAVPRVLGLGLDW